MRKSWKKLDSSEIVPLKELEEMEIKKALDIYGQQQKIRRWLLKNWELG